MDQKHFEIRGRIKEDVKRKTNKKEIYQKSWGGVEVLEERKTRKEK